MSLYKGDSFILNILEKSSQKDNHKKFIFKPSDFHGRREELED